jgi:NADH dehydrogenase
VIALSRRPPSSNADGVEWIQGDLVDSAGYASALKAANVVVHAAAKTGRAPHREYYRVNVDGTATLLRAVNDAGTRRLVFVSTIAVTFGDLRRYPYAHAKAEAEALVRGSGLSWTIIRPTIVTGRGAPVVAGLKRLAGLPVVLIFGSGKARVQPIWVEDLATILVDTTMQGLGAGETLEIGGPDIVTIEEMLLAMHRILRSSRGRVVHLPLGPTLALLAVLERVVGANVPLTAGQLATFRFDGVARSRAFHDDRRALLPLPAQLARSLGA